MCTVFKSQLNQLSNTADDLDSFPQCKYSVIIRKFKFITFDSKASVNLSITTKVYQITSVRFYFVRPCTEEIYKLKVEKALSKLRSFPPLLRFFPECLFHSTNDHIHYTRNQTPSQPKHVAYSISTSPRKSMKPSTNRFRLTPHL